MTETKQYYNQFIKPEEGPEFGELSEEYKRAIQKSSHYKLYIANKQALEALLQLKKAIAEIWNPLIRRINNGFKR